VAQLTGIADRREADKLRNALVDKLVASEMITMPAVERAFRTVPRHEFVPAGTPLEVTYDVDASVATKKDDHGVTISSISAAYIQARMIEQAGVRSGHRVLEIGSGGPNAALLAEVAGPGGEVVSADIDPDVIERARERLAATGYAGRVRLVMADAEHDLPADGLFDRILVTAGAWDIPPSWLRQLAPDGGVIVVPLRMNGITRSLAMRRDSDHLVSTSAEVCGFVAMQGDGAHAERVFRLPDGHGHAVSLRFDGEVPADMGLLDGVLGCEPEFGWSGVSIPHRVSFADLHLWLAWFAPGFCQVAADDGTPLAGERLKTWFPFGLVDKDSLALLAVRPASDVDGVEFGARSYGPGPARAAAVLVSEIQAWDRQGRGEPPPVVAFWPEGTTPVPGAGRTAVLRRRHGVFTISWPAA
jgi:protein-L-isoaspartate(D-aspartate) O-methyltransferase